MERLSVFTLAAMALVALLPSPTFSQTVLWDVRHSDAGYSYLDDYQGLANHLWASSLSVVDTTDPGFATNGLGGYDAVVVSVLSSEGGSYTSAEVDELVDYVAGGGGLLIMGDNALLPNANIQLLATEFGVTLGNATLSENGLVTSNFADDPIFDGVSELHFQAPGEILVGLPSVELAWEGTGKCLVAAAQYGNGRVITLGDASLMKDAFLILGGNQQFSTNVFGHLAQVPEPATLALFALGAIALRVRKRA